MIYLEKCHKHTDELCMKHFCNLILTVTNMVTVTNFWGYGRKMLRSVSERKWVRREFGLCPSDSWHRVVVLYREVRSRQVSPQQATTYQTERCNNSEGCNLSVYRPVTSDLIHQYFSTFVRLRPGKFFFFKRRGPGPKKFTHKYLSIFLSSYIKLT